jgi:hypothetical protein
MVEFLIRVCVLGVLLMVLATMIVQKLSQTYFMEKEKHLERVLKLANERGE